MDRFDYPGSCWRRRQRRPLCPFGEYVNRLTNTHTQLKAFSPNRKEKTKETTRISTKMSEYDLCFSLGRGVRPKTHCYQSFLPKTGRPGRGGDFNETHVLRSSSSCTPTAIFFCFSSLCLSHSSPFKSVSSFAWDLGSWKRRRLHFSLGRH